MHELRATSGASFGELLRRHRLAAGLSQEALAERARMSTEGISALERGYRRSPQRETLELLAGALALDAERRRAFEEAAARSSPPRRAGTSVTVGPWSGTAESNLPFSIATFIGRERELAEIAAIVGKYRLITITGAGGVGKTQTALQVVRLLSQDAGTAACFIGLASTSDPSLVTAAIASALGVEQTPRRPLLDTLIAYVRNRELLLLLDNCEHVVQEAAGVSEALLAAAARVRIIATSREPLMATGERRYQLPSLSIDDAVALFVDRAQGVDVHFTLSDENAPLVAEICRRLDGIPLAIELAAARVNLISLKALNEKLDDRLPILTGGRRTALPQQRTMRAAIDWSYDLLSAREQRIFERLAIFVGGCTLAAASAVCAGDSVAESDVFDALASLVDKSLVTVDLERSEPRYGLLESFRQYAHERLAARGELDAIARRHTIVYSDLALREGRGDATWVAEQGNYRAAIQWSLIGRGDLAYGWQIVSEMGAWDAIAPAERQSWVDVALELADETIPESLLAKLHTAKAMAAFGNGKYEASVASSTAALAHYRLPGDLLGIVRAKSHIGHALNNLGRTRDAEAAFGEALALLRERNDPKSALLAGVLMGLGLVASDIVLVRSYFSEARRIYEEQRNSIGVGYTLTNLSEREFIAGNVEIALRSATDALQLAKTLSAFSNASLQLAALNMIAICLVALNRHDEAAIRAREMLALAQEHGLNYQFALAAGHLAVIATVKMEALTEEPRARFAAAARVLGFADDRLARIGSLRDSVATPQYERCVTILRNAIGSDALAELMAEGALLPEAPAITEALAL